MEYFYSYQVQLFSSKLHCVLHYEFIYYGSTRSSCKHLVTNQYALSSPRPALNGRATTLPQGLCTYITLCLEGLSAQNYKFCFFSCFSPMLCHQRTPTVTPQFRRNAIFYLYLKFSIRIHITRKNVCDARDDSSTKFLLH